MTIRGPKELLLELLAINGEIEKVEGVANRWQVNETNREAALKALIYQKLLEEE